MRDIVRNIHHEEIQEDHELHNDWETGDLGKNPNYVRRVSDEKCAEIDNNLGLQSITIRIQKDLIEQLKILAKEEGLGYQPYIRQLLTRHVKKIKN